MKKIIITENQFNILKEISFKEISEKCSDINTSPSDAQINASNYKMGHFYVKGMPISIENPIGSRRKYKDENGNDGFVIMKNHYGYFTNTTGNGKDGIKTHLAGNQHFKLFDLFIVAVKQGKKTCARARRAFAAEKFDI